MQPLVAFIPMSRDLQRPSSPSHGEDYLAGGFARLEQVERLRYLAEIEGVRHMRLELALLEPAEELREGVRHELGLVATIGAPEESDDVDVLHQHDVRRYLRDAAAGEADDDDASLPGDRAQALIEGVAADRIIDDIDAAAAGDVLDAVADLLARIVDEVIGAGTLGDLELVRPARRGDHRGAHRLGDLDRGQADAARRAEHQHPLAELEPAAP